MDAGAFELMLAAPGTPPASNAPNRTASASAATPPCMKGARVEGEETAAAQGSHLEDSDGGNAVPSDRFQIKTAGASLYVSRAAALSCGTIRSNAEHTDADHDIVVVDGMEEAAPAPAPAPASAAQQPATGSGDGDVAPAPADLAPVIFLDCDGVLANARSHTWEFDETDPSLFHHPTNELAPLERRCLAELQRIVEATGAAIVLSTTWRVDAGMRAFLVSALTPFAQVVGDTPNGSNRGSEVAAWLAAHPTVPSYVILDDGHEEGFERAGLTDRFVQTVMCVPDEPSAEGLTPALADRAIEILMASSAI